MRALERLLAEAEVLDTADPSSVRTVSSQALLIDSEQRAKPGVATRWRTHEVGARQPVCLADATVCLIDARWSYSATR